MGWRQLPQLQACSGAADGGAAAALAAGWRGENLQSHTSSGYEARAAQITCSLVGLQGRLESWCYASKAAASLSRQSPRYHDDALCCTLLIMWYCRWQWLWTLGQCTAPSGPAAEPWGGRRAAGRWRQRSRHRGTPPPRQRMPSQPLSPNLQGRLGVCLRLLRVFGLLT